MLDVLDMQRRYYVFDKNTIKSFIKMCDSFTAYTLEKPKKSKSTDIFYDSAKRILEENGLLLRKRILGAKSQIKLKRRFSEPQHFYSDALRKHEREKEVATKEPLSKHFFFLNNALNSMYSTPLNFDPDKLFEQMKVILTIDIKETSWKVFGAGGFKAVINHDIMTMHNYQTKRKNSCELIQIKMLSADSTLPYFQDFITKIEKHCKEIFFTQDSRYEIAQRITKPLPTKEELKKLQRERALAAAEAEGTKK